MEESKEKERNLIHDHFLSWVSLNPQKHKWVEGVKGTQKGRMGGTGMLVLLRHRDTTQIDACHLDDSGTLHVYKTISTAQGRSHFHATETK